MFYRQNEKIIPEFLSNTPLQVLCMTHGSKLDNKVVEYKMNPCYTRSNLNAYVKSEDPNWPGERPCILTLVLLTPDMLCLCKQCRSKSVAN